MSTTATQEQAEDTAAQARRKATRLARFFARHFLKDMDENSALLPPDRWIIESVRDFARTNESFRKTIGRAAGFAGGALLALGAGVAGAVMAFPSLVPLAAVGLVALAATAFLGKKAHDNLNLFKAETLPELRRDMGKKYLEFKMGELKAAWQRKMDARQKQKEAEKAQKQAAAPKPAAAKPAAKKEEAPVQAKPADPPAPETRENQAVAAPVAKKPEEPKTIGGTIGNWVLKKAMEQAQKRKDKGAEPPAAAPEKPKPEQPPKP